MTPPSPEDGVETLKIDCSSIVQTIEAQHRTCVDAAEDRGLQCVLENLRSLKNLNCALQTLLDKEQCKINRQELLDALPKECL